MRLKFLMVSVLLLGLLLSTFVDSIAQGRVGFGYSLKDDGNCPKRQEAVVAEYEREEKNLELRGKVRTSPSGGDCRQRSLAYDVSVARYFSVFNDSFDAMVKFGASEQSAAAPYELSDAEGNVLPRADGGALFGTHLPAGSAKTIVGVLGLSKDLGPLRVGTGINFVPVDWASEKDGRTAHFETGFDWKGFDFNTALDVGADSFGQAFVGYRQALDKDRFDVGFGLTYYWGIDALDNGAPQIQTVRGAPFVRAGAPRSDAIVFEITLGYKP